MSSYTHKGREIVLRLDGRAFAEWMTSTQTQIGQIIDYTKLPLDVLMRGIFHAAGGVKCFGKYEDFCAQYLPPWLALGAAGEAFMAEFMKATTPPEELQNGNFQTATPKDQAEGGQSPTSTGLSDSQASRMD